MNREKVATTLVYNSIIISVVIVIISMLVYFTGAASLTGLLAASSSPTRVSTPLPTGTFASSTPPNQPPPTPTLYTPFPTVTPLPTMTLIAQSVPTQIAMIQGDVTSLRQQVDTLSRAVASNPNPELAALRTDLKSLDGRLAVIEKAVLDNPERALQLTLLSRDIDNLKATNKTDAENTRQEIARVYDLTKWFIGLMFTIALSVLGLALSNLIKKPEKVSEKLWTPSKKE